MNIILYYESQIISEFNYLIGAMTFLTPKAIKSQTTNELITSYQTIMHQLMNLVYHTNELQQEVN